MNAPGGRGSRPVRTRVWGLACAAVVVLALSACGEPARPVFPAGSTMARLQAADRIVVGVKFDQPGVGFRNPATGRPEGFDIEMAKIVAAGLGLSSGDIDWVQTVSADRETFLEDGRVDIVIASYSITADRRVRVGQAGPYYQTGQRILVRRGNTAIDGPEDLAGAAVCSVKDSTSLQTAQEEFGARPVGLSTYTECVQRLLAGKVAAVTTDDAVLVGYARKQPDKLQVVGQSFHEERYGIGYRKGDTEFCRFLTATIVAAERDGRWRRAFDETLGQVGVVPPTPPTPESC
jgi:glutamate transport system substrate-binding protein